MKSLNRDFAKIENGAIVINEDELDIFDVWEGKVKPWEPSIEIPEWEDVNGCYWDIETTGLDPEKDRVVMIGAITTHNEIKIYDAYENEKLAIKKFFRYLDLSNFEFIAPFNGIKLKSHKLGFDFPFLKRRCEILDIHFPFWEADRLTVFRTAQMFSTPINYNALWFNHGKTAVIDLFHQLLSWDFVARKLVKHDLKSSPVALGLRKEERVTLDYEQLKDCYEKEDWDTVRQYLISDLEDTKMLGDFLLPAIWYQKLYLPDWKLQSLSTAGNGSKWNSILENSYKGVKVPVADEKLSFQGALTFADPGLKLRCIKLDVESLYPHLMLIYGIYSIKDTEGVLLSILAYLLRFRIKLKEQKEAGTIKLTDKQREATAKVFLNSGYGGLSTAGLPYNDMIASAFVTAYGRAVYKHIFKLLEDKGYKVIQGDTDGLIIQLPEHSDYDSLDDEGKTIAQYVNDNLPGTEDFRLKVKFEWGADGLYIPHNIKTGIALRKNYLVYRKGKCQTLKGRYVKRDRAEFDKKFQPEYVRLWIYEGKEAADNYYQNILDILEAGLYPTDMLATTRKIKINEKKLPALDIGEPGTIATFYMGVGEVPTKSGAYDIKYYRKRLETMYKEVLEFSDLTENIDHD
jgi:DNA polymerase, archaea type